MPSSLLDRIDGKECKVNEFYSYSAAVKQWYGKIHRDLCPDFDFFPAAGLADFIWQNV